MAPLSLGGNRLTQGCPSPGSTTCGWTSTATGGPSFPAVFPAFTLLELRHSLAFPHHEGSPVGAVPKCSGKSLPALLLNAMVEPVMEANVRLSHGPPLPGGRPGLTSPCPEGGGSIQPASHRPEEGSTGCDSDLHYQLPHPPYQSLIRSPLWLAGGRLPLCGNPAPCEPGRWRLGWPAGAGPALSAGAYQGPEITARCRHLALGSDVVLLGSAPDSWILPRLRQTG